jgi:outer membrane protein assembly factor BamD (BamD/ComL family)
MGVSTYTQAVRRWARNLSRFLLAGFACAITGLGGCSWDQFRDWDHYHLFTVPPAPPPPVDSLTIRGDRIEAETPPAKGTAAGDLAGAKELYRQGDYSKAERIFRKIADNTKNTPPVAEEARYYQAECLRQEHRYPRAADTYNKMLTDFPSGAYREQAIQHMFEIANYWLDDTRKEMELAREKREGKRWFTWPEVMHFEKEKPLLDEEGRAMEKLEQVHYTDITGPLADKALFLAGSVKFYRGDYKDADHFYSMLVEMHPNSPFAQQAIELSVISKQLSTGGPEYDGRKLGEARKMIDMALRSYPELASQKGEFLTRQLRSITLQQADKDYQIAEFYRRTGHPCSAYFCYEIVRRRYPGTKYFDLASERMQSLRAKLEKSASEAASEESPSAKYDNRPLPESNLIPGQPEMGPPPRPLPPELLK